MPQIPQKEFEDDSVKFKDMKDGEVLNIVEVEFGTTPKNGYECVTITLVDGNAIFGTDRGVINALKNATDEFGLTFQAEDPLVATVASYTDKFGNSRKKLE